MESQGKEASEEDEHHEVPKLTSRSLSHSSSSIDKDGKLEKTPDKKLSKRAQKRLLRKQMRVAELKEKGDFKKIPKKKPDGKSPNFEEMALQETSYYYQNDLRKVYPYYFNFTTYAKGRWIGQTIMDIFTKEFRKDTPENYEKAIEDGKIIVNGNKVSRDYVFKDNDFLSNTLHRHEVPVTADNIEIIADNEDVLVVNKPSSIPVHPCGRYRHNSLVFILAKDYNYQNLRTIYRLDRLTSGVFIFCKTESKTKELMAHVKNRTMQKQYICKVQGQFPSGEIVCRERVDILSHKVGLFKVGPNGKEASTTFERVSTDGITSVVMCYPHTGRTHQIRVHLQYLGFPIVNDPLYNSPVWGRDRGKGGHFGKPEPQLIEELIQLHNAENYAMDVDVKTDLSTEISKTITSSYTNQDKEAINITEDQNVINTEITETKQAAENETENKLPTNVDVDGSEDKTNIVDVSSSSPVCKRQRTRDEILIPKYDPSKMNYDPKCPDCQLKYRDPAAEDLVMYLHALKYKGPGWEYETKLPVWAMEDSTEHETAVT